MLVKKIKLVNFMPYAKAEIELPLTGIILVTGENGCGKSSLYEAVAVAHSGKTTRGTSPWAAKKGSVEVETDKCFVHRKHNNTVNKLIWNFKGKEPKTALTNTKAQEELALEIGSFDFWKKTHVFSLTDVSNFTAATDSERKRFLESILDLSKFDTALKACRKSLSDKEKRLDKLVIQKDSTTEARDKLEELLIETSKNALCGDYEGLDKLQTSLDSLGQIISVIRDTIILQEALVSRYEKGLKQSDTEASALEYKKIQLKEKLDKLRDLDECPTCTQEVCQSTVEELEEETNFKLVALDAEIYSHKKSINGWKAGITAQQYDISISQIDLAKNERQHIEQRMDLERSKVQVKQAQTIQVDISTYNTKLADLSKDIKSLNKEITTLKHCDFILGLKGLRATLLGTLLGGIEAISNQYLAKLSTSDSITLKFMSYKQNQDGSISDSIDIQVEGVGGGYGYKAASAGERRRIDVAILLALADVAVSQDSEGTLWFDEVLDSLDKKGCGAVIEVLQKFAEKRNVVLISHSDELVADLDLAAHFEVKKGTIERIK